MFSKKMKEYKEKQTDINEKMQRYTGADEKFYLTANTVLSLAKRAKEIFKSSKPEEKRKLLNFLLQNLKLDGKKLSFELKTPFDTVLEANKCSIGQAEWDDFRTFKWMDSVKYPDLMLQQVQKLINKN